MSKFLNHLNNLLGSMSIRNEEAQLMADDYSKLSDSKKAWDIDNDGNKELLIEASADWYSSQQGWNSFKLINGKLTRTNI